MKLISVHLTHSLIYLFVKIKGFRINYTKWNFHVKSFQNLVKQLCFSHEIHEAHKSLPDTWAHTTQYVQYIVFSCCLNMSSHFYSSFIIITPSLKPTPPHVMFISHYLICNSQTSTIKASCSIPSLSLSDSQQLEQ